MIQIISIIKMKFRKFSKSLKILSKVKISNKITHKKINKNNKGNLH